MTVSLKQIQPTDARRNLSRRLLGSEQHDDATLDAELMRRAVWALTSAGNETHISRALNLALDAFAPLEHNVDHDLLRRRLRNTLDELGQVGDLVELPGGYWHPAAVREVAVATPHDDVLLVGGVPTSALPEYLRDSVTSRRAFRWMRRGLAVERLGAHVEELAIWLGRPSASLVEWGQEILQSDIPETNDAPEARYYVPDGKPAWAAQRHRWQDKVPSATGRYLADFTGLFGVRQYRIAEVRDGRTRRLGAVLMPGESRRLMYAIDALAHNPVSVELLREGAETVVVLRSELPGPELRLLGALGTLETPRDHYYPRRWRLPRERESVVRDALSELHVLVANDQQGRGR